MLQNVGTRLLAFAVGLAMLLGVFVAFSNMHSQSVPQSSASGTPIVSQEVELVANKLKPGVSKNVFGVTVRLNKDQTRQASYGTKIVGYIPGVGQMVLLAKDVAEIAASEAQANNQCLAVNVPWWALGTGRGVKMSYYNC